MQTEQLMLTILSLYGLFCSETERCFDVRTLSPCGKKKMYHLKMTLDASAILFDSTNLANPESLSLVGRLHRLHQIQRDPSHDIIWCSRVHASILGLHFPDFGQLPKPM